MGLENGFKLIKERNRSYPTKTITDADFADDIALLANAPAQPKTLLHSLERAAAGIGLHVSAHKTEYMCFNHFHTKHLRCETSRQVHLPREQCLINQDRHQPTTCKGIDSYQ